MSCRALIRVTLNAGLMKPRKGFTLVAGKEKLGVGKEARLPATRCCLPQVGEKTGEGETMRGNTFKRLGLKVPPDQIR